mgnify:CR=1 FL=1
MSHWLNKVLVIGLGLIGGSLAKSLREQRACTNVVGFDRDQREMQEGLRLGVIDSMAENLAEEVSSADLVVLAVPVKATEAVLEQIKPFLTPSTILTDVGSTKGNVVEAAERVFGCLPVGFVPGHPIAGSEKSGVAAADSQLFNGYKVILTPLPDSADEATPTSRSMHGYVAEEITTSGRFVTGLIARPEGGKSPRRIMFPARAVVMAAGGVGHLYEITTNPTEARGGGIGMAARAGAMIADAEFVQFHPTAINVGKDPAPLATEALRGEGCTLHNSAGERFMLDIDPNADMGLARSMFNTLIYLTVSLGVAWYFVG